MFNQNLFMILKKRVNYFMMILLRDITNQSQVQNHPFKKMIIYYLK